MKIPIRWPRGRVFSSDDLALSPHAVLRVCTRTGRCMCGIDTSQFTSKGCVELGAAASGAAQMGYSLEFPEPRACGGGGADTGTP